MAFRSVETYRKYDSRHAVKALHENCQSVILGMAKVFNPVMVRIHGVDCVCAPHGGIAGLHVTVHKPDYARLSPVRFGPRRHAIGSLLRLITTLLTTTTRYLQNNPCYYQNSR